MSNPFAGEIRMFAGSYAPLGWALCDGKVLPISDFESLFNVIGTTYGGDGEATFALPDLRGRIPVHQGAGYALGVSDGQETVTVYLNAYPVHNHLVQCSTNPGAQRDPAGNVPATVTVGSAYAQDTQPSQALAPQTIQNIGGGQPHDNIQPYLCISFIISMFGVIPSQN